MRLGRTWVEPGVRIFVLPGEDGIAEETDSRLRLTLRMRLDLYKYFFLLFYLAIRSLSLSILFPHSYPLPLPSFTFLVAFCLFSVKSTRRSMKNIIEIKKLEKTRFYLPFFPARPLPGAD